MVRARTSCVITVPRSNHGNSGRRSFVANSDHPYHSYSPYTLRTPCSISFESFLARIALLSLRVTSVSVIKVSNGLEMGDGGNGREWEGSRNKK